MPASRWVVCLCLALSGATFQSVAWAQGAPEAAPAAGDEAKPAGAAAPDAEKPASGDEAKPAPVKVAKPAPKPAPKSGDEKPAVKPGDEKPAAKPGDEQPGEEGAEGEGDVLLIEEADVLNEEALKKGLWLRASVVTEVGFVGILSNKIQYSQDGSYFDFVEEGGQDVLFPFYRLSVELEMNARHRLIFLYNPLELNGQTTLTRDITVDGLIFAKGTPLNTRYNFPFYRVSYLYDLAKSQRHELSIGLSMQVRNATISFTSADGRLRRERRDVGPVPILKARGRYTLDNGLFFGGEVDGFYAPVSYLNGSDSEVVGAILDSSVRAGVMVNDNIDAFLNVRYLGGGGVGTGSDVPDFGDGYTKNWLHTMAITLGFVYIL